MLSPATKTFENVQVTFVPLPLLSAMELDARVASLVLPLLELLEVSDLSKMDINLKSLGAIMSKTLSSLKGNDLTSLVVSSLAGCTVLVNGRPAKEITDAESLNEALKGIGLETLYQIIFEAWRFNKLSPFTLAARFGLKTIPIHSFAGQGEEPSKGGIRLERSES